MKPYFSDDHVTLYHGDCRDVLPGLGPFETCITDPPYSLGFLTGARTTGIRPSSLPT